MWKETLVTPILKKGDPTKNRALQHSMGNFYREFPQLRCTELQLKMRLAGLHLQLKRVVQMIKTRGWL